MSSSKVIQSLCDDKIIVVLPSDYKDLIVPLFCKLCRFPMKTKEDVAEFKKRKVCECCSYEFGDLTPKKKSKEWKLYIESRRLRSRTILKLK